jgi:DNA-directed RNA polymerase subunit M/transcription elongation factor TFIIS
MSRQLSDSVEFSFQFSRRIGEPQTAMVANTENVVVAQLKGAAIGQTFQCEACGKNFISEWLLKIHRAVCPKSTHGFACPICQQQFTRSLELVPMLLDFPRSS